jgi:hypothetical protein
VMGRMVPRTPVRPHLTPESCSCPNDCACLPSQSGVPSPASLLRPA